MSPKLLNILLLIGSLAIYYLVIGPLQTGEDTGVWSPDKSIDALVDLNKQYDQTIPQIDKITEQAKSLNKIYTELNSNEEMRRNLQLMVPSEVDEVRLLNEVSKIAGQGGIAIKDLTVKDKSGAFPKYSVTFSLETTYPKFKDFITNYEKSMRLFTIESVSFNAPLKEGDLTKFNVILSTHYLK